MHLIENPFELSKEILEGISKGALLNVKKEDGVNSMAIGWGSLGTQWGRPILTIYVKSCRYSHELLDKAGEFSINVPYPNEDEDLVMFLGRNSGRNMDKIKEAGLSLLDPIKISTPALNIPSIVIECEVIYRQEQVLEEIRDEGLIQRYYLRGDPEENNPHTVYEGLIKSIYINR